MSRLPNAKACAQRCVHNDVGVSGDARSYAAFRAVPPPC